MNNNPWLVDSISAFSFLNCPECPFRSKEENLFSYHAAKNHPLSTAFFDKQIELEQSRIGLKTVENDYENINSGTDETIDAFDESIIDENSCGIEDELSQSAKQTAILKNRIDVKKIQNETRNLETNPGPINNPMPDPNRNYESSEVVGSNNLASNPHLEPVPTVKVS